MDAVDPCVALELLPKGTVATVYAKDQPEYTPLPTLRTPSGVVISRWTLSDEERKKILQGEDLFLAMWTFSQPLQPVYLTVGSTDWRGV